MEKILKILAVIAAIATAIGLYRGKQGQEDGQTGIPIENIAPKYNITITEVDAKTLRKNVGQELDYYLKGKPTPTSVTLKYTFEGDQGDWCGTIVFNPSTLKGSFREEYPGKMPKFGTINVKPHYTGGFEITFIYDKEIVSFKALALPVWW